MPGTAVFFMTTSQLFDAVFDEAFPEDCLVQTLKEEAIITHSGFQVE